MAAKLVMAAAVGCLLLSWVSRAAAADLTPAEMLNNFCPCTGRSLCNIVFGSDGQAGLQGLLEVNYST